MEKSKSNKELVSYKGELFSLIDHLTFNKKMVGTKDKFGKRIGFFKKVIKNGEEILQLHVRIPLTIDKHEWYWFNVLDADKNEVVMNKKLNVTKC